MKLSSLIALAHVMGLYALYPCIHAVLLKVSIELPIHEFQYQSVFSSIAGGPFLLILGIVMIRLKIASKLDKILGYLYLSAGFYWIYRFFVSILSE
jgi:hypothetical protein